MHKSSRPTPIALKLIRLTFQVGGYLFPRLTGRIAYQLWFTPTRHKTPTSEKAALKSAKVKHLQVNHHDIITYSWGQSDKIILLVHGWSGRGTQLGTFVQPLLEAGYQVLSFDAPAHGSSSGKQTNAYEITDTLLALQQHYGHFHSVISHSFGGPCVTLAMQGGFKTNALISISPPATTMSLVEKYIQILRLPKKASHHLIQGIETNFGKNIWDKISMLNTVKEIDIPGLLIHDSDDTDVPWQEGQLVAQEWCGAKFIKTSGLGHRRILKDPTVIELAVKFINHCENN